MRSNGFHFSSVPPVFCLDSQARNQAALLMQFIELKLPMAEDKGRKERLPGNLEGHTEDTLHVESMMK
jgi:hypothetical protein